MHLAIVSFTLLLGYYAAASPSIYHAQIQVKIKDMDFQENQVDVHLSEELAKNHQTVHVLNTPPYNFTISACSFDGIYALPFGFPRLGSDGSIRGELGSITEFTLREGRWITGNRGLGYNSARVYPPWTSLWSLDKEYEISLFKLTAIPQDYNEDLTRFSLEFQINCQFIFFSWNQFLSWGSFELICFFLDLKDLYFGAHSILDRQPIFVVADSKRYHPHHIL